MLDSGSDGEEEVKPMTRVNQYVLMKCLGRGSFAKIFLGFDTVSKKYFALKRFKLRELLRIDGGISQLEREIASIRKIVHENTIRLHEVLYDEGSETVYLVLDYANCGSLEKIMQSQGFVRDGPVMKYIFLRVLKAVAYLHAHGIVHQDIKPGNILVSNDGRVYLSDFGVGHSFQSTDMVVGSPGYQAPEALKDLDWVRCDLDPSKEDMWSLGVTFYQCLFGLLPYAGANVYEIIQNIGRSELYIPKGTNEAAVKLLKGMLNIDPAKRITPNEAMESPFFDGVESDVTNLGLEVEEPEAIDLTAKMRNIKARQCDPHYSFARTKLHNSLFLDIPGLRMDQRPLKMSARMSWSSQLTT
jgi:serine/threonine-protein kinase 11